jgi:L-arabinose transport system permease protein
MLVVFLLLFLGCCVFVPHFNSKNNLIGLGLLITTVGIISCTMLLCMAAGDFDLSIGSILAMAEVIVALLINYTGKSVPIGAFGHTFFSVPFPANPTLAMVVAGLVAILAGGLVGFFNGFVIAKLGINALITTLATMQIVRGLCFIISSGQAIGVANPDFAYLGNAMWLGLPLPVWIMVGCWIIFGLLLHKSTFGRNTLAIGGNREAARLAGINVTRDKIIIFTLQGLVSAFAGVVAASQFTSGQPNDGMGLELKVIAACVLGGVSLTGGIGTILSVIVGTLIMGTVQNAMDLKNVPTFYQYVASGSILLAAVLLDRLKQQGG